MIRKETVAALWLAFGASVSTAQNPGPKALDIDDVVALLGMKDVSAADRSALIRRRCISFLVDPTAVAQLKGAGADDATLGMLLTVCNVAAARPAVTASAVAPASKLAPDNSERQAVLDQLRAEDARKQAELEDRIRAEATKRAASILGSNAKAVETVETLAGVAGLVGQFQAERAAKRAREERKKLAESKRAARLEGIGRESFNGFPAILPDNSEVVFPPLEGKLTYMSIESARDVRGGPGARPDDDANRDSRRFAFDSRDLERVYVTFQLSIKPLVRDTTFVAECLHYLPDNGGGIRIAPTSYYPKRVEVKKGDKEVRFGTTVDPQEIYTRTHQAQPPAGRFKPGMYTVDCYVGGVAIGRTSYDVF